MKYLKILYGVLLIGLGIISAVLMNNDSNQALLFQIVNIVILVSWGLYLVIKKKKTIIIKDNSLIVKKGSRNLKELDLSQKVRVIKGNLSLKIIFPQYSETFIYSDFEKVDAEKLRTI